MVESKKPKGGRRPGAGRPPVDSQAINLRLKRTKLAWIDAQPGRRSEVVERLVSEKQNGGTMKLLPREHELAMKYARDPRATEEEQCFLSGIALAYTSNEAITHGDYYRFQCLIGQTLANEIDTPIESR